MLVKAKDVNTLDTAGFNGFHFIVQARDTARAGKRWRWVR